jgi:NADH-quinone oxidoreductase subunit E
MISYPPGKQRSALIPMLLFAQDEVGAVTSEVIDEIAGRLGLAPLQVEEVLSYYSMLRRQPGGRYRIQICTNVSCMLTGANELWENACKQLGIGNKQTTPDGTFTLEEVECLGACSWGPALQVNYEYHHNVTPEKLDRLLEALRAIQRT